MTNKFLSIDLIRKLKWNIFKNWDGAIPNQVILSRLCSHFNSGEEDSWWSGSPLLVRLSQHYWPHSVKISLVVCANHPSGALVFNRGWFTRKVYFLKSFFLIMLIWTHNNSILVTMKRFSFSLVLFVWKHLWKRLSKKLYFWTCRSVGEKKLKATTTESRIMFLKRTYNENNQLFQVKLLAPRRFAHSLLPVFSF